jgi:hypothetical protein
MRYSTFNGTTAIQSIAEQRRESSQKKADKIRIITLKLYFKKLLKIRKFANFTEGKIIFQLAQFIKSKRKCRGATFKWIQIHSRFGCSSIFGIQKSFLNFILREKNIRFPNQIEELLK